MTKAFIYSIFEDWVDKPKLFKYLKLLDLNDKDSFKELDVLYEVLEKRYDFHKKLIDILIHKADPKIYEYLIYKYFDENKRIPIEFKFTRLNDLAPIQIKCIFNYDLDKVEVNQTFLFSVENLFFLEYPDRPDQRLKLLKLINKNCGIISFIYLKHINSFSEITKDLKYIINNFFDKIDQKSVENIKKIEKIYFNGLAKIIKENMFFQIKDFINNSDLSLKEKEKLVNLCIMIWPNEFNYMIKEIKRQNKKKKIL